MVTSVVLPSGDHVYTGRIKPKGRPRTLHLANYLDPAAAESLPVECDYVTAAAAAIKRCFLNDRLGCCVIADVGHALGVWTANESGTPVIATDAEIGAAYNRLKAGPGDTGCSITDVLDAWTANGIMLGGKLTKIDGYIAVDWRQKPLVQAAILAFGGMRLGVELPAAWASTPDGGTWGDTNTRIVGGHDIRAVKYDAAGVWIATWGGLRLIPWDTMAGSRYIDEAYVELSPDWYAKAARSPTGLDGAALKADLALLSNGTLPPIVAAPTDLDWSGFA